MAFITSSEPGNWKLKSWKTEKQNRTEANRTDGPEEQRLYLHKFIMTAMRLQRQKGKYDLEEHLDGLRDALRDRASLHCYIPLFKTNSDSIIIIKAWPIN